MDLNLPVIVFYNVDRHAPDLSKVEHETPDPPRHLDWPLPSRDNQQFHAHKDEQYSPVTRHRPGRASPGDESYGLAFRTARTALQT